MLTTTVPTDLYLCDGTYRERIVADDDLALFGTGSATVVLDAGYSVNGTAAAVITGASGANLTIYDITLQDGYDGVSVDTASLDIQRVIFEEFTGGIAYLMVAISSTVDGDDLWARDNTILRSLYAVASTLRFTDVSLTDNSGGYLFTAASSSDLTVDQLELRRNSFTSGVYVDGPFELNEVTAVDNDSVYGAVTVSGGTGTINDLVASGNTASYGGAIGIYDGSVTVNDPIITGNLATGYGGGIYRSGGDVTVSGGTLAGNEAVWYGGAMYGTGGASSVSRAVFRTNRATLGAGMYETGSAVVDVSASDFVSNTGSSGGGIYAGGGTTLDVYSSLFEDNVVTSGGGAVCTSGAESWIQDSVLTSNEAALGGAAYFYSSDTVVFGGQVTDNIATYGGGIRAAYTLTSAFTAFEVEVSGNYADEGGGLSLGPDGEYWVTFCAVSGNAADYGGGLYATGGTAEVFLDGTVGLTEGTMGNTANVSGGGIYIDSTDYLWSATNQDIASNFVDGLDWDFGTSAGGDANDPDDVVFAATAYDCVTTGTCEASTDTTVYDTLGNDASFCYGPGCP